MLRVKNIFGPTIQGEGQQAGLPAIFVRFAGCNIWDGREETRFGNPCYYCDTDFVGGTLMSPLDVIVEVERLRGSNVRYLVVLTGGEPMLQPTTDLVQLVIGLRSKNFITQMETNGTLWKPEVALRSNFITVSPKKPLAELKANFNHVSCLKILYPHSTVPFGDFLELPKQFPSMDFCVQPVQEGNAAKWDENTKAVSSLVKRLGWPWRISIQTHKIIGEE